MSVNVRSIIQRVRNTAGDINVLQFTNEMLIDWLNDGIKQCVITNSLCQKVATQNTVVGTAEYDMPPDIFKLYSITVDGSKIPVLTLQQWEERFNGPAANETPERGRPSEAYMWAKKLTLYPAPEAVYAMRINYIYEPEFLEVDDAETYLDEVPAIPSSYHDRLVVYCLAQIALQDEDLPKYQVFMQEFATGVIDLRHQTETEEDLYPFMSVSSRDTGDGSW